MSDQGGYVKMYRKSLHSPIWKNMELWRFWSWCLLKASYKPVTEFSGYKAVDLQPGQLLFSRRMAHKETGLSERTVKTCLDALSEGSDPSLAIKAHHAYTIVTVLKMPYYQGWDCQRVPQAHHQTTQSRTTTAPPVDENERGFPSNPSEGDQRECAPAKPEVEEVKKTTHISACEIFEASMSPSYLVVMESWKEQCREAGRSYAPDLNTREGARIIADAMDKGHLSRDRLAGTLRNGLSDKNLPSQGLRGIAANYARYMPVSEKEKPEAKRVCIRFCCPECGAVQSLIFAAVPDVMRKQCDSSGCGGIMNGEVVE